MLASLSSVEILYLVIFIIALAVMFLFWLWVIMYREGIGYYAKDECDKCHKVLRKTKLNRYEPYWLLCDKCLNTVTIQKGLLFNASTKKGLETNDTSGNERSLNSIKEIDGC